MGRIGVNTSCTKLVADAFTPVGIYLRLRDRFRDTVLLESTDHDAAENSWSFICVNAIAGIEISGERLEMKYPGEPPERTGLSNADVPEQLWRFMSRFDISLNGEARFGQRLYGYTSYEAAEIFESRSNKRASAGIPPIRYRFYQYVLAIDHFRDQLFLCENHIAGIESEVSALRSLIQGKQLPQYPFSRSGPEIPNMGDEEYREMVRRGIIHCRRGDVFQVVLSRRFEQGFRGDEFNVYRALRGINPSPYLFYFDYGDYRLFGSSPESQLIIENGKASIHPIAGTVRREEAGAGMEEAVNRLLSNPKENAEHVMLVDLARNDLSRLCENVAVSSYRQVKYFSHVVHLVSEVSGSPKPGANPFDLLAKTFPAGTLTGAPKIRAMELISALEPDPREYYGGMIGYAGFDGSSNHAIIIRSFLSRNNRLIYQAGAGVVVASDPEAELHEVHHKLGALRAAISAAEQMNEQ
ncbi:MAG TPA: anthranilate synthase component I family protein [Chitinophagaceae bacterium]|nr:anthranilate synthase component I family protein [Chitinophagaceae bacterium]